MAVNLIEMLTNQMGGSVLSQASQFLGESEDSTKSAMGAALPAILGSVIQKGSNQEGAQGIMDMISKGGFDGGMLGNMGSMFGGGDATSGLMKQGTSILSSLMGNKMGSIVDVISSVSGMGSKSSSSLMGMVAPMIMSAIGKQVMGKGVSGLMSFLGGQSDFVKAAAPSALSNLMGFSNLGGNMTDMAGKMANTASAAVAETADAGSSMMKKWMPLGLVALLAVGLLWFFRGGSVADAASVVAEKTTDVVDAAGDAATTAMDAAGDAATSAVDAAGDAAGAAVDATGNALSATVAAAQKALEGVTFAAGSVGEKFTNFLSSGTEGNGESFAFNNLTFKSGSAEMDNTTMQEVDNFAAAMTAYPNVHIEIGGHTDNVGKEAMNLKLSGERAAAVKAHLTEKGISADRISTKGYGPANPVADNSTEAGREQNRRIEIKITQR